MLESAAAVNEVFASYPPKVRKRLQQVRQVVLETAEQLDIGDLVETLKWNEVSYLPAKSGIGSTLRMGYNDKSPEHYMLFVHCGTSLLETFQTLFPELIVQGNRAVVFELAKPLPRDAVAMLAEMTLTYHRTKRKKNVGC